MASAPVELRPLSAPRRYDFLKFSSTRKHVTGRTVQEIVAELQEQVAQRRIAGDYPVGLESELEAEFDAILEMTHRGQDKVESMRALLVSLSASVSSVSGHTPTKSRIPGGRLLHRLSERVSRRQVRGLAGQTRQAHESTIRVLADIIDQFEVQRLSDERLMNRLANSILDRVVVIDQLATLVVELERRVKVLEAHDNG